MLRLAEVETLRKEKRQKFRDVCREDDLEKIRIEAEILEAGGEDARLHQEHRALVLQVATLMYAMGITIIEEYNVLPKS